MGYYYKEVPDGTYCLTGYEGNDTVVNLPSNIIFSILNDKLFKGHDEIKEIILPNTIKEIGGWVFEGCTNLRHINLPDSLEGLWQYAFTRSSIESIIIPGSLKRLIPFNFSECKALKEVKFLEGVKEIGAWAFKDCTALRDVYLPESIEHIHENAFVGCSQVNFHKK